MTGFGPYLIEERIGRGGMGEVYRARDREHGDRLVAVKVLRASVSADPQYRARFRREAEHAAALVDPHIPAIHRYGELDGHLFLDMELVAGRPLSALVGRGGTGPGLPVGRAVELVGQIAAALDCAHRAGLVHRDVKPANVMVDDAGGELRAALLDFGIATPVDPGSRTALTRTGVTVGTLAYMAPERFLDGPVAASADVYALGCVLYEVLTGAKPFDHDDVGELVAAHLHREPPRPSAVRADVPAGLDAVVARGMAKDPAARYSTAGELARAARAALGSTPATVPLGTPPPVAAPPPAFFGPPQAAARSAADRAAARRRRGAWLLPAGLGVVLGALVGTVALLTGIGAVDPGPAAAPGNPAAAVVPAPGPIADRVFPGAANAIDPVRCTYLGATPVLVTGDDLTAGSRVLDLVTGEQLGVARGPTATVAVQGGTPVLLTSNHDGVIRVSELGTGTARATTLTGHSQSITNIAAGEVDGRPVLASGSLDGTVRLWDLDSGQQRGEPIQVGEPVEVQFLPVDGRQAVVGVGTDGLWVWDADTGAPIGDPVGRFFSHRTAPPVGVLDGRAVAVTTDGDFAAGRVLLPIYDLATGAVLREVPLPAPTTAGPVTVAEVDGRQLLLRAEGNAVVQYDALTGAPVGGTYTGHEDRVDSLAVVTAGGRPYLLTSGADRAVRVWDMTARNGG